MYVLFKKHSVLNPCYMYGYTYLDPKQIKSYYLKVANHAFNRWKFKPRLKHMQLY